LYGIGFGGYKSLQLHAFSSGFWFFGLYVSVAVFSVPQDGLSGRLDSLFSTVFCACFGVSYKFFSKRLAWLYIKLDCI
jgi:hypothetical protein